MELIRYSCGHILGPLWTDSCKIWCLRVFFFFYHVLRKYGYENAEMRKRKFDDITLQYSIDANSQFTQNQWITIRWVVLQSAVKTWALNAATSGLIPKRKKSENFWHCIHHFCLSIKRIPQLNCQHEIWIKGESFFFLVLFFPEWLVKKPEVKEGQLNLIFHSHMFYS